MILRNKIKKIIDAIENSDISEIEISSFWGFQKIKLKKGLDYKDSFNKSPDYDKTEYSKEKNTVDTNEPPIEETVEKNDISDDFDIIKAPLVGTFYQSKKPGDPPFIELDSKINIGDTICIIEAMKIFNEIESEYSGTIKEILVQDGEPVEFDQPLFKIHKI